jgi:hypothetical protein
MSMIAKRIIAMCVLLFSLVLAGQSAKTGSVQLKAPIEVKFCDLIAQRDKYLDANVAVRVRMTYLKEGTSLWDPSCPNLGVVLMAKSSDEADQSINELYELLKRVGLSSHPVIAMLTGVLKVEQSSPSQHRNRLEFFAYKASDVSQTSHVERRHFEP